MPGVSLKASTAQLIKIQTYMRDSADRLGLKDWNITLSTEPTDSKYSLAEVNQTENQHGTVRLCGHFLELTPETQRDTITHELCHLKLSPIDSHVESLESVLDPQSYAVYHAAYSQINEQVTEAFCRLTATLLPTPDFGKPVRRRAAAKHGKKPRRVR